MIYQFSVILDQFPSSDDECLEIADKLGNADCLDASIAGHTDGMEVVFARAADSLDAAIGSAVLAVESAGFVVKRVEVERESITGRV